MKNTLSENMMRFGTKNLSELAQKELIVKSIMETINQHGLHGAVKQRLTEGAIDLTNNPAAPVAAKVLQSQYAKGIVAPTAVMGQYYLKTRKDLSSGVLLRGEVGGINGFVAGGILLPIPSALSIGEGGSFDLSLNPVKFDKLTSPNPPMALPKTEAGIADSLNKAFNEYPLASLQAMFAAHPKKAAFQTAMATFKASTSELKSLLTGNAKAFFGV